MGGKVISVAAPPFETRNIVIAQGIQFNNKDYANSHDMGSIVPDGSLKKRLLAAGLPFVIASPGRSAALTNMKQGVNYTINVVNTKSEFVAALESDKTHIVIYDGHARFGRGCCFGTDMKPSEDWENGTTFDTGLFRMGYPYVAVPVKDIVEHGYTADIVSASEPLGLEDCEPDLRRAIKKNLVKPHSLKDIPQKEAHKKLRIDKNPIGPQDRFWAFDWAGEGFSVISHAGWEKTASAPMDLGPTDIRCRVFCHFGCSSRQHYQRIVCILKGFLRVGDTDNFSYFTSDIALGGVTSPNWLFHLLSYDQFNAGQAWGPILEYARVHANRDIQKDIFALNKSLPEDQKKYGYYSIV
jgi:hypothetical protein